MSTLDPDLLIEGTLRGDATAAEALVERLHPLVIRIVRAHLPRTVGEEDLAQEVFLKLLTRLDRYQPRPDVPFEHWVARLAVRTCLDRLRSERRRPEWRWSDLAREGSAWLDFLLARRSDGPESDAAQAREVVEHLLAQLPAEDRLVLTLLDLEERPVQEICAITGWGASRIKVRAFRARRRLRDIARTLGEGGTS